MLFRKLYCKLMICLLSVLLAIPLYAETFKGEADAKPWSGYWWPLNRGELVNGYVGHPSPIEKYDLYTQLKYPGEATRNAKDDWYDSEVPNWYGICNGWANAAILEDQKFSPSVTKNILLNVGDKKGLLSAIHAKDETLYEFCNNPESFHRYLLHYIGEQGLAVAADLDSSEEFWSYPIYSYKMDIVKGITQDQVQCRILHANDLGFLPDFEGTVEVKKTYYYNLDKDDAGNYIKGGGSWQGSSVNDHPDIVWVPIARRPEQLFIDYNVVKEMALTDGDDYTDSKLVPGHHVLMVEPKENRNFEVVPLKGCNISLKAALDRQSVSGNTIHITIKKNKEKVYDFVLGRNLEEFIIASKTGNDKYEISLIPEEKNHTGCAVQLYVNYKTPYEHWLYGFPQSRYWLGSAALLNNSGEVAVEIVGDQGLPAGNGAIGTVSAKERILTILATSATEDYYSANQPVAVKICGSEPLSGLIFAGDESRFWGTSQTEENRGKRVVIPSLTKSYNWNSSSVLYLVQKDEDDNPLEIEYYKDDGSFYRQEKIVLTVDRVMEFEKGSYPGGVNIDGWALVKPARSGLDGAILSSIGKISKDQLPLLNIDRKSLVPHTAVGNGWQTKVTFYNPDNDTVTVVMTSHFGDGTFNDYSLNVPSFAKIEVIVRGELWGVSDEKIDNIWIALSSESEFSGFVSYQYGSDAIASLPLISMNSESSRNLPHLANNDYWWTGVVLLNRSQESQTIQLTAFAEDGQKLEVIDIYLNPYEKYSNTVGRVFTQETVVRIASIQLDGADKISAIAIFGTLTGENRITAYCW